MIFEKPKDGDPWASFISRSRNEVTQMGNARLHGIRAASAIDALCIAIANSQFKEMALFLADGVDINGIAGYSKSTPLATAASHGVLRAVEFLIEQGADLNKPGNYELSPLMQACSSGKVKGSKVALALIAAGADVDQLRKSDGMTALKFAVKTCSPDVVQALLDAGAEVDGPKGTDQTALMLAARNNNVEALKVLVKNGADIHRPCLLPWAEKRTAEGLALMDKKKKPPSIWPRSEKLDSDGFTMFSH